MPMMRKVANTVYEWFLRHQIDYGRVPEHIAVIQDGNRRFAREKGESPEEGHKHGAEKAEELLDWASEIGVKEVTLYTFSTENFRRPDNELDSLFSLMEEKFLELADDDRIHSNRIRIRAVGDLGRLPDRVEDAIREAEEKTSEYDEFHLNIAVGYGGRDELLRASREVLREVEDGDLEPDEIDTEKVSEYVYTPRSNDVDLMIRTGGEERLSNFLPWQAKGNESAVYFCDPYWPAFRKIDFLRAIRSYADVERSRSDVGSETDESREKQSTASVGSETDPEESEPRLR
ncbi:MAG: polyprenyl diphosphate synthase [Halobacteria archaeon]|nr:polyprenyl diphosphate synthase [Halobacteria archaeon]